MNTYTKKLIWRIAKEIGEFIYQKVKEKIEDRKLTKSPK